MGSVTPQRLLDWPAILSQGDVVKVEGVSRVGRRRFRVDATRSWGAAGEGGDEGSGAKLHAAAPMKGNPVGEWAALGWMS